MAERERIADLEVRLAAAEARIAALEAKRNWPDVLATNAPGDAASYFDRCPCNPKNGGSGICGCILGGLQVRS
jgi:hypothetical protein